MQSATSDADSERGSDREHWILAQPVGHGADAGPGDSAGRASGGYTCAGPGSCTRTGRGCSRAGTGCSTAARPG
jgi:hypothetical protein